MENSDAVTLRKHNARQMNSWLDVQSAHMTYEVSEISSKEREWRAAILNGNVNEMSRILSKNPELVNWQDYISGNTALHFAAKVNDMFLVRLLAGTHKANVELRNHGGLVPLHMAALGASEEVAFELMSKYGAKATVRDYSGRLPVTYLPNTDAGLRLKSHFRSQYEEMLKDSPALLKMIAETQRVCSTPTPQLTPSISPLQPASTTQPTENNRKPAATKRGKLFACTPFQRRSSLRRSTNTSTDAHAKGSDYQIISRDDLPPATPTRISDFPVLSRHRSVSRQRSGASDYHHMVYSTIRSRKTGRGKNYNPTDPESQQTSFRRLPSLRSPLLVGSKEPHESTNEVSAISSRVPRSQNRAIYVTPLPPEPKN